MKKDLILNREDVILNYLTKNKGGLTVKECMDKLGTTELRKVISNLRASGFKVADTWERGLNRYGMPTRYKRYFLLGKGKSSGSHTPKVVA